MDRYLVFDSSCSTCTYLAETIQSAAGGRLKAISIHSAQAKELLDRAYPRAWVYAPYLVDEGHHKVRAWTGTLLALRLGLLLGPRKAWRVWTLARLHGVATPPERKLATGYGPTRRQFLKAASALALTLGLSAPGLRRTRMASADVGCPCLQTTEIFYYAYCSDACPDGCNDDYTMIYRKVDPCGNQCGTVPYTYCDDSAHCQQC